MASGPVRTSVQLFATALVVSPFAIIGGVLIQALKKYRPANILAWITLAVGTGLLSLLRADSSTAQWVGYQLPASAGQGFLVRDAGALLSFMELLSDELP